MKLIPVILIAALAAFPASAIQYLIHIDSPLEKVSEPEPGIWTSYNLHEFLSFEFFADFESPPLPGYDALFDGSNAVLWDLNLRNSNGGAVGFDFAPWFTVDPQPGIFVAHTWSHNHGKLINFVGVLTITESSATWVWTTPDNPELVPYAYNLTDLYISVKDPLEVPESGATAFLAAIGLVGIISIHRGLRNRVEETCGLDR